ncbi:MAG: hypothetical protein ACREVK_01180 [Gammaproteobacteria bacterium]
MYDAARYATKTGRESEALEMLDKCIDLQPQTIITMFSEEDFLSSATMRQGLASLLIRKTEGGRVKARRSIGAWRSTIAAVQQAEKMAEYKTNGPTEEFQGAQRSAAQIQTANYILAAHLDNKAMTERNAVIATATRALLEKIEECQRTETTAKQEILRAEAIS